LIDLLGLLLDILGACTVGSGDQPATTRPRRRSRWFWPLTATVVILVIAGAIAIG
jgi:hypothetical protein